MKLPSIRSTRVKKLNVNGLPKGISIVPWSNQQMIIFSQMLEDIKEENLDEFKELNKIRNTQFEQLVKPNIQSKEIELSVLQKQLLLVEIYKISRAVKIAMMYPCNNEECNHSTEGYFNLNEDIHYRDIKESSKKIGNFTFHIKEDNTVNVEEIDDGIKYTLGYIDKVIDNKNNELDFTQDELVDWVLNELPDNLFDELLNYLENNVPNIVVYQDVKCELCNEENRYIFKGIPDFSLGLLE